MFVNNWPKIHQKNFNNFCVDFVTADKQKINFQKFNKIGEKVSKKSLKKYNSFTFKFLVFLLLDEIVSLLVQTISHT